MRWYAGAIAILLAALLAGLGLLAYAMYVLLAVLLLGRFLARSWAENLAADRQCNRFSAHVGDKLAVVLRVENRGLLPVAWALLEDLLPRDALASQPPKLTVLGKRLQLAMLGPRGRRTLYYQLRCNHRGYYQVGPLVVETGDLFGLHRRWRLLAAPHFVLVYPKTVALEGYDIASRRPIGQIRMTHRLYEDPTRIAGVRQYQTGDPLNRIHWRATARTGLLHSKVYEPSSVAGATLLLDFHRDSYAPEHEPYRSELAITAAASLANALYQMGQQVGLVTNARDAADRIRRQGWDPDFRTRRAAQQSASMLPASDRLQPVVVQTQRGPEQLMRILEALARLELTDGLRLSELIAETAGRIPRDATVLALLCGVSTETALALGGMRRRGWAVTAIINAYHIHQFEQAAAPLVAEGIEVRPLTDQAGLVDLCRQYVLR
ncbi:MAG: DUF58 domain-containing protein [Thermoguttaceae bacterium]